MANILITGATGTIGTELTKHLVDAHNLKLVGRDFSDFPEELKERATIVIADLVDPKSWDDLLDNVEYVIQLAGEADQNAEFYGDLIELNYKLPHNLFEAATKAESLKRIIFASSIHAVEAYPNGVQVKTSDPVRPSNLYGVSKVFLEGLASHHAYVNGIESIGIRIGDYKASDDEIDDQMDENGMAMYLSKADFNHLIDRCLETKLKEPFLLVNGVSNNTFTRLSNIEAQTYLNYEPQDDAFKKMHVFEE
jgi:uronate dehydrogenase